MAGSCILSKFYIKPQLRLERELARCSCILSKFYIKPQLACCQYYFRWVVSYRNSTSNHNAGTSTPNSALLYLIEILHQTTTSSPLRRTTSCCILSKFYIKPQRITTWSDKRIVVSYRNSTSNHNSTTVFRRFALLYLIEILHQTTTSGLILIDKVLLTGCLPL